MTAAQAAFYYLAAASAASALLAVTRRSPVHSLLWVLSLFLHVAGVFLLVGAEYLAAVQVIVYAGAILVFYLIVLMLLDLPAEEEAGRFGPHWPLGAAAAAALAALVWGAVRAGGGPGGGLAPGAGSALPGAASGRSTLSSLGAALYGEYALPFEAASVVLLAAIVGAVVLARPRRL